MNPNTLLFLVFLGLSGCKSGDYLISTYKTSYNLKGTVRFVTEKTIPSICDSTCVYQFDSANFSSIRFRNLFFDENGKILKWEYFQRDSILTSNHDFIYSSSGKFKKLDIYHKGKLNEIVKTRKHSKTSLETETFDYETNKLTTVYQIEYVNGLVSTMTVRDFKNKTFQHLKYKQDYFGNEIEISRKSNSNETEEITIIKYLEFDSIGNWTKRIEFKPEDTEDCKLVVRRIEYF
jgi:hypothetical protein